MAIVLVVGSVLLLVSAFTWVARREAVDRARRLASLRYTPLEAVMARRLTAVRASAVSDEPIVDPVTQEPVAFFEARLARLDGGDRTLRNLRGGPTVRLEDGTGSVEVQLEGADLALPWEELEATDGEPSPRMRQLLEEATLPVPELQRGARFVIFHRAIRVGDALTVVGRPTLLERSASSTEGYRGGTQATASFEVDEEGLVVTDGELETLQERERTDLRAMTRMVQIAAALGVMMVGLGAALLARS